MIQRARCECKCWIPKRSSLGVSANFGQIRFTSACVFHVFKVSGRCWANESVYAVCVHMTSTGHTGWWSKSISNIDELHDLQIHKYKYNSTTWNYDVSQA